LKIGQSLWAAFYEGSKELRDYENAEIKAEGFDPVKKKAELEALKTKAKTILIDGVTRMQASGEVSPITVTAVLSLAQIYVDTNEAAKAATLLEDPKIGTLTLTRKNDPTTQRDGFQEETYKTALRAYISSLSAAGANSDEVIKKAEGAMASLDEMFKDDPKGQAKLIGIYISLAKDLQKQMELADPASKVALGKGFEAFLGQMSKKSSDVKILNWVAETYRGMGESFGPASKGISPEAARYFDEAVKTYQRILKVNSDKPGQIAPAMVTSLKLQIARTNRATGKYKEAMDLFDEILKTQNMLLPVQIEAAKTYQDWGALKGDKMEVNYQRAIFGAREVVDPKTKQKKNNIWGWAQIAKVVSSKAEYKEIFHESRFNLALARYAYAMKLAGAEQKSQLGFAKRDIAVMYGFYPDLGGDKWKAQYEALLKNIQIGLGERPVGLTALKAAEPPPASGTTPAATTKTGTAPAATTPTKAPAATPTKAVTPPAATKAPAAKTAPAKS
jgi:tetratricopeptide (TPR) repeat protein